MSQIVVNELRSPTYLEGPEYPDIKKDILRFTYARKHWKVDAGEAIKQSEKYPMFLSGVVEFQSRDRNVTQYGQQSHRDYVNEEVRFPLISPWDLLPLSRKPVPWSRIVPRNNPGLFDVTPVTPILFNGLGGYFTDRVKPNFPIVPMDSKYD
jgi:hypothetical protein